MSSFSSEHRFPLYFLYELLMSLRRPDKVTIFFDVYFKNLFTLLMVSQNPSSWFLLGSSLFLAKPFQVNSVKRSQVFVKIILKKVSSGVEAGSSF